MRYLNFVFGGEEYQVKEPNFKAGKAWRKKFEARMSELASIVEGDVMATLQDAANLTVPESTDDLDQLSVAGDILKKLSPTINKVFKAALGSIDEAADLVFTYGPELKNKRDEIEEIAYSDEIVKALWVVIQSAYPFLSLKDALPGMLDQIGLALQPTSTNSPGLNGEAAVPAKSN